MHPPGLGAEPLEALPLLQCCLRKSHSLLAAKRQQSPTACAGSKESREPAGQPLHIPAWQAEGSQLDWLASSAGALALAPVWRPPEPQQF
jgi:hypothetical protein